MSSSLEDRIQSLLDSGKITPEDAARLRGAAAPEPTPPEPPKSWEGMSVAGEGGQSSLQKDVQPASPPASERPRTQGMPRPPEPPEPPLPPMPENAPEYQNFVYTGEVRKVIIQSWAGNIEVSGGGSKGRLEVESSGGSFQAMHSEGVVTIRNQFQKGELSALSKKPMDWLQDPMKALRGLLPSNLELTLPEGVEVLEIHSMAGNIEVHEVLGRVEIDIKAGNVELQDAPSFRIHSTAGNVEINTRLSGPETEKSSVISTAGNVEINLEHGSSVRVQASTQAGHMDIDGMSIFKREKRVVGERIEATLGSGDTELEVRVQAGNLEINGEE